MPPESFEKLSERFRKKVRVNASTGCWDWLAYTNPKGYGMFGYKSTVLLAHRYIWEQFNGPIPPKMFILHQCDNPTCVNPQHLFLGSHQDNMKDMTVKRRQALGQRNGKATLSDQAVNDIRNIYTGRYGQITELARIYNVSTSCINGIVKNIRRFHG